MKLRFVLSVAMAVALTAAGCSSDSNDDDAGDVLNDYVTAYNSGDIDAVMALFTEESTITGHPTNSSATGLTAIRALHVEDMSAAADTDAYSISNVQVTGNNVKWDHIWTNSTGNQFCKTGQSTVTEGGKIVLWTWPGGGFNCA